ncbi:phospholipase [Oxalobacteraceae bacterium OM1]|nr:phospholipase [Oxalobacteraceae bacterium OM1]
MLRVVRTAAFILALGAAGAAAAWSNHALGTWQALSVLPEVARATPVPAESLEHFLLAAGPALEQVLANEEAWARANVPQYPARPDALAYRAGGDAATQRARFLAALRINPESKLPLFLQTRPGTEAQGRPALPWTEVTTLRRATSARTILFLQLREGEAVAPLEVVASASDEPDYGLDLGVWEDNDTPYGKVYGFGKQPFGSPKLEFSSQAPLHMGFFHENWIMYKAAGFLKRTFPEYRIHLYQTLSQFAFRNGHPYWGWRFAGWALHYVQDLTQPYHARVVPGVGTPKLLWANTADLLGFHRAKADAITLVSNRHQALENYQYNRMRAAYLKHADDDALLRAARDTSTDARYAPYNPAAIRSVVTQESHAESDATDAVLEHSLPSKYISDPAYTMSETEAQADLYSVATAMPVQVQEHMTAMTAGLMRHFGAHSRSFIRALAPAPSAANAAQR